jgi:hypothetical protein
MNIYGYSMQNDPLESQVITVGLGIDSVETTYSHESWECSPEEMSNVLTWGCGDSSSLFSFSSAENTVFANRIRKVDLKNKVQWLD